MSRVFFISDTHFGHEGILKFGRERFPDIRTHDEFIIEQWNKVVHKRDTVYHCGDFSWRAPQEYVNWVRGRLKGYIKLLRGNHDQKYPTDRIDFMPGLLSYKGFWISHPPIHPQELRNRKNIHGHVHTHSVPDERYINVSCEAIKFTPISFEELKERKQP